MSQISLTVLKGNSMKLDGGSMFGNAPKSLWQSWMPADDRNMIEIASKCLLVRTAHHKILFETGAGAYLSPEMKQRFQVREPDHRLLNALGDEGVKHSDITHVILSHLHFDHAGGLLAQWESDRQGLELLFPNAQFIVGEKNFNRAASPHPRDKASFIPGLTDLLNQSGRLTLYRQGEHLSLYGVEIEFTQSQGHTPGMLVSWIRTGGRCFVFTGDLVPAHPWVNLPITMGFDRFPEGLIDEKRQLLEMAKEEKALLVFPHDPVYDALALGYDAKKDRIIPAQGLTKLDLNLCV